MLKRMCIIYTKVKELKVIVMVIIKKISDFHQF
jgi:hypothetical protein